MRYVKEKQRGVVLWIIISLVLMSCVSYAEEGKTVNKGLEITISQAKDRKEQPEFRVTFKNVGSENFVLNLGLLQESGKGQYPTQLKFTVTEAGGKIRHLQFLVPLNYQQQDQCDDYIVSLGVGSSYTLTVSLYQLWDVYTHEYGIKKLPIGEYYIQASYTGVKSYARVKLLGVELLPKGGEGGYWEGQVTSNSLQFLQE